jgi:MoaA/NifB/PqqE/SkfB family radical SAM enzyme
MAVMNVLLDFLKGKHTSGQMLNLVRYILAKKESVVNWDPLFLSVFLTYKCNLSCDMCLTHSRKFNNPFGQKPCNDVDFELFKQILNRYKNALTLNLIGNGDPLLHKDLFKMIEYASNVMKVDVSSSSNGILVGKYIEEIITSPLKKFDISLNGHNSNEFNRMTGMPPELFDTICDNTAELMKQKIARHSKLKIAVSIILDQENYRHLKDMICFADGLGVDEINFFQFLPVPEKGFTAEERCLFSDDSDVLEVFGKINSLPARIRKKVILPPLLDRVMDNNKNCPVWFRYICVDGNENVGGCCCQLLDLSVSGKFSDIDVWNNAYFQEMRKRFIDPKYPLLEPCTWCYQNSSRKRDLLLVIESNPLFRVLPLISQRLRK